MNGQRKSRRWSRRWIPFIAAALSLQCANVRAAIGASGKPVLAYCVSGAALPSDFEEDIKIAVFDGFKAASSDQFEVTKSCSSSGYRAAVTLSVVKGQVKIEVRTTPSTAGFEPLVKLVDATPQIPRGTAKIVVLAVTGNEDATYQELLRGAVEQEAREVGFQVIERKIADQLPKNLLYCSNSQCAEDAAGTVGASYSAFFPDSSDPVTRQVAIIDTSKGRVAKSTLKFQPKLVSERAVDGFRPVVKALRAQYDASIAVKVQEPTGAPAVGDPKKDAIALGGAKDSGTKDEPDFNPSKAHDTEQAIKEGVKPPKHSHEPAEGSSSLRTVGWVLVGVGAAAVVGGGVMGVIGHSSFGDIPYKDESTGLLDRYYSKPEVDRFTQYHEDGVRDYTIGGGALLGGAVAAGVGAVLLWIGD